MSIEYYYVNDLNKLYNAAVGNKTDGGEYHTAMMEAHDNLEEYIAELEAAQRWIPVSERLPEDWTMVLFTNGVTRGIGQFDKDGFYDYWYEYSFNKPVTHWMPLPNPPEVKL